MAAPPRAPSAPPLTVRTAARLPPPPGSRARGAAGANQRLARRGAGEAGNLNALSARVRIPAEEVSNVVLPSMCRLSVQCHQRW